MMSLSSVLMAPVRGVVWLVRLPFVLIWMLLRYIGSLLYRAVAAVLSVPAYYLGRLGARLKLMWIWTKTSASKIRLCFPFTSNYPDHSGTYRALPPPGREYDTYYLYPPQLQAGEGASLRRRRHSSNRKNRKAIAAALAKLLLEPSTPSDSDEDCKALPAAGSSQPEEVEERTKLIMDLLKISKTDGGAQVPELTPQDLQALRERARNKEQLESLIAEMERTDPSLMLTKKQQKSSKSSSKAKKAHQRHRTLQQVAEIDDDYSQAVYDKEKEEEEGGGGGGEGVEEIEPQYTAPHRLKYTGDLSPVQESPEYKPEEMNYKELEKDLNLALSRLNSEISELHVDDEEVREEEETFETQITHIVTVTQTQHQPLHSSACHEEFPNVPKVSPSLGIKAGHDRRDVAAARKSRPPSRRNASSNQQSAPSQVFRDKRWQTDKQDCLVSDDSWDEEEDSEFSNKDGSGESDGEIEDVPGRCRRKRQTRKFVGSLQLSDQLSLLSPTSKSPVEASFEGDGAPATVDDVSSLYAKVDKKKKKKNRSDGIESDQERPRTGSDPTPTASQSKLTSRGLSNSMTSDYGGREVDETVKEKNSPALASSQPPWIQMRARRSSESTAQSTTSTTTTTPAGGQPPWIQMRSHKNSSSGYSSLASTPTTNSPLPHPPHPHSAPQLAVQSTNTTLTDASGRVLPPKPSIPRPDPPSTLIRPYSSSDEEKEEENADIDSSSDDKQDESFYDSLRPREEEPQRESRIFPLAESRSKQVDRPRYLHELVTDDTKEEEGRISRGRRAGSLRINESASPALPARNSASKLKRTSSADTVRKPAKKDRGRTKERHSSSSSSRERGRSDERGSSDGHRQRHHSSSGDRTPSQSRRRSSEKRDSTSSSKGSPSPKESTTALGTVWKLLATPTSSRRRHSSSKDSSSASPKSGEREVKRRKSSSSKRDNSPGPMD